LEPAGMPRVEDDVAQSGRVVRRVRRELLRRRVVAGASLERGRVLSQLVLAHELWAAWVADVPESHPAPRPPKRWDSEGPVDLISGESEGAAGIRHRRMPLATPGGGMAVGGGAGPQGGERRRRQLFFFQVLDCARRYLVMRDLGRVEHPEATAQVGEVGA